MRKWRPTPALRGFTRQSSLPSRWFSSGHHVETVTVPCASAGSIDVNLHNVSQHRRSHPLVIYIPPFFQREPASTPPLPAFLERYPSAVINYRWLDPSSSRLPGGDELEDSLFQWPFPIHDTLFGYTWILQNLVPPGNERRDVYVYGSYLGASLAASLALTESRQDQQMAVRGFVTYNGIYNWTMFLPDHPIHRSKSLTNALEDASYAEGSFLHYLRDKLPVLFPSASGLFDPFASPSLFFRDPGLWVPEDFTASVTASPMSQAIDALAASSSTATEDTDSAESTSTMWNLKPPPKSYLTFPPWRSTLKIPEALLLYEPPPPLSQARIRPSKARKAAPKKKRKIFNNFEGQATELSNLMRRSIDKYELRNHEEVIEDNEGSESESLRRIQTRDVGVVEGDGQLGELGQDVAAAWLRERIGR